MQKEELARANADTALNSRCDTIAADVEEVRDLANHKVDTTTYTEGQAAQDAKIAANKKLIDNYDTWQLAQDSRITALEGENATSKTDIENIKAKDTAQDAAIQQNKDAIANVTGSLSGYVKTETYTAGQAAQDAKITAAQTAADKANTNIGDWETEHPNQTISQCATSLENETAANAAKADANTAVIGDWNAEHASKTIAQEVTRLSGAIPDVSGFVTETTYNQGQAAQNANIGDWHTTYPTHTITQMVTNIRTDLKGIDFLNFLDKLYPEGNVIFGTRFEEATLYPCRYEANTTFNHFFIPVIVPYIVSAFGTLWTANINAPTTIIMYDVNGMAEKSKRVTSFEIKIVGNASFFQLVSETPFNISATSVYYFRLHSTSNMDYSWTKNATPFSSLA